jgi:hypothetical protein
MDLVRRSRVTRARGAVIVLLSIAAVVPTGTSPVAAEEASGYVPLSPARLVDTRVGRSTVDGQFAGIGPVSGAGNPRCVTVAGRGGVPSSGVAAVALNVTVTEPTSGGYLTVWPAGETRPTASNVNFTTAQTVPNFVIAKVGAAGQVCFFSSADSTHVVVDVFGYFPSASGFYALSPGRVMDTRPNYPTVDGLGPKGFVNQGQTVDMPLAGRYGLPSSGVAAVVLNVTVTSAASAGYVTVYSTNFSRPTVSNLNFVAGQTVANLVAVPVGVDGSVRFYNWSSGAHLIADIAGWVPFESVGSEFGAGNPARLLDTRSQGSTVDGSFKGSGPLGQGGVLELQVTGRAGIPPEGVSAAVLNVTATGPTSNGYLTVWPTGVSRPTASNVNFVGGQTVPNLVFARVGDDGKVSIYNPYGATHVVVDVQGWVLGPSTASG